MIDTIGAIGFPFSWFDHYNYKYMIANVMGRHFYQWIIISTNANGTDGTVGF